MSVFEGIADFSMMDTMNTDAYCVNALQKDVDYLKAFDTDRLLAGFRETAGLDTKGAKRYAGWESTLIGGHTLGHYLTAAAQACVNPGVSEADRAQLLSMVKTLIDGLLACQLHSRGRENYLFGAVILDPANVELQFDNIEKDKTNIITEAWVPWYTLHKLLAGVLDVFRLTGYENALSVARRIGDWTYERAMGWDAATAAQVIRVEYGGMNEVLYEVYALTGEDRYAIAAHFFDSEALFERILAGGEDALNNHHANTTIPKFIGALRRYTACHGRCIGGELVDASRYFLYAKSFFEMVVARHTYVTGGNSEWEHFGRDFVLDRERTNCNCETCNVYNMLKLARTLFCLTGDAMYAEYYENAFYNTILSSQNPETGMTTYFQPMATGYFKVFGQRFDKFWCCTGTGMENFTKLNDSIYFRNDSYVFVNLYLDSQLTLREQGGRLTMQACLQKSDTVRITVEMEDGVALSMGLALRIPAWCAEAPVLTVDGVKTSYQVDGGYALLPAGLESGSEISFSLPMKVRVCPLPDNERSVAFCFGPTVLSADLGCADMATTTTGMMVTIPAGKVGGYDDIVLPKDITPEIFMTEPERFLVRVPECEGLVFRLTVNGLTFAPHFKRYKERYGIYFNVRTEAELAEVKRARELALMEKPEGVVIDTVQPGYGQYENDELHRMYDWGGSVGSTEQGTSRYAKPGGSFTYHMCVSEADNNYLSLTFLKADSGMSMKIASGDEVFFEEVLCYEGAEDTFELRVKVPESVVKLAKTVQANGETHRVIPLTFKGSEGAQSARLFGFVYMMNY